MTTEQYLTDLVNQKNALADNLVAKGVEATHDEKLNTLVPKVLDIQSGEPVAIPYAPRGISFRDYKGSSLDYELANLDTSNLTTLKNMFYGCSSLTSVDVSKFNTSKVTNMESVFYGCKKLTELNLSSFDISKVNSSFYTMFNGCSLLTELNLSSFGQNSAYETSNMFYNCSALTSINLSNFITSNVTSMGSMFYGCKALMHLDIRSMTFDKATSYNTMFTNVPAACEIIVKSDTERDWILARRSDFTNIKTVAEL